MGAEEATALFMLQRHWEGVYTITRGDGWMAVHKDGGPPVTGEDAWQLRQALQDDYAARRHAAGGLGE